MVPREEPLRELHEAECRLLPEPLVLSLHPQRLWPEEFTEQLLEEVGEGLSFRHTELLVCRRLPSQEAVQSKLMLQQHGDPHQETGPPLTELKEPV